MVGVIISRKATFGPPELLGAVVEIVLGGAVCASLTPAFKLLLAAVVAYRKSLM